MLNQVNVSHVLFLSESNNLLLYSRKLLLFGFLGLTFFDSDEMTFDEIYIKNACKRLLSTLHSY
jgi:hypothetical protein